MPQARKLILSRKGFDSTAGGCPSPVFPDGRFLALPIPDEESPICYWDLTFDGLNLGELVGDLTGEPARSLQGAHLDPDIIPDLRSRLPGWRPSLGQAGQAQAHLRNEGVGEGDLFLFFGLFREVEQVAGQWQFRQDSNPFHALWGWLQVEAVRPVEDSLVEEFPWVREHPHYPQSLRSNTLYIGSQAAGFGSGVFESFRDELRLTAPGSRKVTDWRLPACFYPEDDRTPMSYHRNRERWGLEDGVCCLRSASRGQEFVLDGAQYPEAMEWAASLIR